MESSIVRIKNSAGEIWGAGFVISPEHILTCAHVVAQALPNVDRSQELQPSGEITFDFLTKINDDRQAVVMHWSPEKTDLSGDLAVLRFSGGLPEEVEVARLSEEVEIEGDSFKTFGFPVNQALGVQSFGKITTNQGLPRLQLEFSEAIYDVERGFSGAPIYDKDLDAIVGMVTGRPVNTDKRAAFGLPVTELLKLWPQLDDFIEISDSEFIQEMEDSLNSVLDVTQEDDKNVLNEAYKKSIFSPTIIPETLKAKLKQLMDQMYGEDELPSILKFAIHMASYLQSNDKAKQNYADWLASASRKKFRIDISSKLEELKNTPKENKQSHSSILVKLDHQSKDEAETNDQYRVSFYYCDWGGEVKPIAAIPPIVKKDELPMLLSKVINSIASNLTAREDLFIEFFLPKKLFALAVEHIEANDDFDLPSRIGFDYHVVIRSLDRLDYCQENAIFKTAWNTKWRTLNEAQTSDSANIEFRSEQSIDAGTLLQKVKQEPDIVGLGFAFELNQLEQVLGIIVREGLPIIIFPKKGEFCQGEALEKVIELCGCQYPMDLPKELRRERINVMNDDNHPHNNISLLWDSPERIPQEKSATVNYYDTPFNQ